MYTIEDYEKEYNKFKVNYFKKNFLNKDINSALGDAAKNAIFALLAAQVKFILLFECLNVIKAEKAVWGKFNRKTRIRINQTIEAAELISKDLEEILKPISDGLCGEI